MTAIEQGNYSRALGDRLSDLEDQQETLRAQQGEAPPSTVRLHRRLTEIYAEKVQKLEKALNDPDIRQEAAEVLRGLIDRIELRPRSQGKGADAVLHGYLAEILALCDNATSKRKLPVAGGFLGYESFPPCDDCIISRRFSMSGRVGTFLAVLRHDAPNASSHNHAHVRYWHLADLNGEVEDVCLRV